MIILADNDVVHKLTCCDLLNEFMAWLESPPNEIYILPTLIYKLRKVLKNDATSLARLENFVKNNTKEVPAVDVESLKRFSSLDVGEQALLAVFVENSENAKFLTGDKRALREIASLASEDDDLYRSLSSKVQCLEMIMLGLIEKFGFDAVNDKVKVIKNIDSVLKMTFGRSEAHALEALASYVAAIKAEATFLN